MTRRICRLWVGFERWNVAKGLVLPSYKQGNNKWGSIHMDCFGKFTFSRRKKLRENATTNGLLSRQIQK